MASLEEMLEEGRHALEVTPEELKEARARRDQINSALKDAFPGSRTYINGSVAHGDANTPLTDVDQGVVVADAEEYGPTGLGPTDLMEQARDAIRENMADDFPKLTITVEGRKRSVLVSFGDPVTAGQKDFTADVIVAIDNTAAPGFWIPNLSLAEGWDRSHPEMHSQLVWDAINDTDKMFARAIRLLKHWRDRHGKPLCSWNLKALALESIADEPMTLLAVLQTFFTYAAPAIAKGLTEDPAHVAGPIKLPKGMTRESAAWRLRTARDKITDAIAHENADRPALAQHALHTVLPEVVPDSPITAQLKEEASRQIARAPLLSTPLATPTRGWAPW